MEHERNPGGWGGPWLELSLVPTVTNLPGGESPALLVELS